MQRKIIWEPHYYSFNTTKNIFESSENQERALPPDEDDGMGLDNNMINEIDIQEVRQVISTPFGAYMIDDALNPYKMYEFWMGHTNFPITEAELSIMSQLLGVEALKILSPYRFIIAVGRAFTFSDVRSRLQKSLCDVPEEIPLKLQPKINKLKKKLVKYPEWAIYILPNGNVEKVYLEKNMSNEVEFRQKVKEMEIAKTKSNGILLCQTST